MSLLNLVATSKTVNTVSGTTLTIAKPTGTVDGHLMVAIMGARGGGATWTGAAGWTEIFDEGNEPRLRIAYKVASSEGSSYDFTLSSAGQTSGTIITLSGVTYESVGTLDERTGTNDLVINSVSAATGSSILMSSMMYAGTSAGFTTASGMDLVSSDTSHMTFGVYVQYVPYGATGTRTFSNATSGNKTGINLLLKINDATKPLFFGSPF